MLIIKETINTDYTALSVPSSQIFCKFRTVVKNRGLKRKTGGPCQYTPALLPSVDGGAATWELQSRPPDPTRLPGTTDRGNRIPKT